MQDLFYSIISSSLYVTTNSGNSYTLSDVTLLTKTDTGSFVAVSSSVDVALFPIQNTNLFYKQPDTYVQANDGKSVENPSSFYWSFIGDIFTTTSSNYLLVTSSVQTFVSQSVESNYGSFRVPSGSILYITAASDYVGGYVFDAGIVDKTDNYILVTGSYTSPLVFNFTPTASHYYEINYNITSYL